ncbi:TPM domain-containing protein [Neisseriaceae bacterium ESL0693]|nr:TPM domain-containing protein [Neisseriaceae bacterium ESL0693]
MKCMPIIKGWLCCLMCLLSFVVYAAKTDLAAIPVLTAPVMDTAQMMQPARRDSLNQQLLDFSRQNGSQIVVLTVPDIAPETPFDYATRVMDRWQLGRKGIDDGVLLLLVRNAHQSFLAVGRGLEGAIPDVYARQIQDNALVPQLQQGHADAGIETAVKQIEQLIKGEKLPVAASAPPSATAQTNPLANLGLALLAVFVLTHLFRVFFGRILGSGIIGFAVVCLGWYLHWTLLQSALLGIATGVVAWGLSFLSFFGVMNIFALLGNSSGGGKGGGSGGGGFSGGGGGYGGGGASDRW